MKIFRKMDEMEVSIVSRSEKTALLFAKICLSVWCVYILVTDGAENLVSSLPFLLLMSTVLVQFWSMRILNRKMNRGNSDEK